MNEIIPQKKERKTKDHLPPIPHQRENDELSLSISDKTPPEVPSLKINNKNVIEVILENSMHNISINSNKRRQKKTKLQPVEENSMEENSLNSQFTNTTDKHTNKSFLPRRPISRLKLSEVTCKGSDALLRYLNEGERFLMRDYRTGMVLYRVIDVLSNKTYLAQKININEYYTEKSAEKKKSGKKYRSITLRQSIVKRRLPGYIKRLIRMYKALENSEAILKLREVISDRNELYFIFEDANPISEQDELSRASIDSMCSHVALGLSEIASLEFSVACFGYRNVFKLESKSSGKKTYKIGCFGFGCPHSRILRKINNKFLISSRPLTGALDYGDFELFLAPEVLNEDFVSDKADSWSFGIFLLFCLKKFLFSSGDQFGLLPHENRINTPHNQNLPPKTTKPRQHSNLEEGLNFSFSLFELRKNPQEYFRLLAESITADQNLSSQTLKEYKPLISSLLLDRLDTQQILSHPFFESWLETAPFRNKVFASYGGRGSLSNLKTPSESKNTQKSHSQNRILVSALVASSANSSGSEMKEGQNADPDGILISPLLSRREFEGSEEDHLLRIMSKKDNGGVCLKPGQLLRSVDKQKRMPKSENLEVLELNARRRNKDVLGKSGSKSKKKKAPNNSLAHNRLELIEHNYDLIEVSPVNTEREGIRLQWENSVLPESNDSQKCPFDSKPQNKPPLETRSNNVGRRTKNQNRQKIEKVEKIENFNFFEEKKKKKIRFKNPKTKILNSKKGSLRHPPHLEKKFLSEKNQKRKQFQRKRRILEKTRSDQSQREGPNKGLRSLLSSSNARPISKFSPNFKRMPRNDSSKEKTQNFKFENEIEKELRQKLNMMKISRAERVTQELIKIEAAKVEASRKGRGDQTGPDYLSKVFNFFGCC